MAMGEEAADFLLRLCRKESEASDAESDPIVEAVCREPTEFSTVIDSRCGTEGWGVASFLGVTTLLPASRICDNGRCSRGSLFRDCGVPLGFQLAERRYSMCVGEMIAGGLRSASHPCEVGDAVGVCIWACPLCCCCCCCLLSVELAGETHAVAGFKFELVLALLLLVMMLVETRMVMKMNFGGTMGAGSWLGLAGGLQCGLNLQVPHPNDDTSDAASPLLCCCCNCCCCSCCCCC
mmetsp:Transcript_21138/g.58824  ORF Transcript_21138/g.58824 Transcript_21138/m.58824 type:complete len:236 (+) Transcript_21138:323-1030(+)